MIKVAINSLPLQQGHKTRGIGTYTRNLIKSLKKREDIEIFEFSILSEIKEADLIHYPFFDLFQKTLPLKKILPTIVTVFDTTPIIFPEHYPSGIRGKLNNFFQKRALQKMDAIITISEVSKKDIVKYLGIKKEKIFPIHLAPAPHFKVIKDKGKLEKTAGKYHLPEKFLLYMGGVNWNKNLLNIAEACIKDGVNLVLAGKDFENRENLDHPERKSYKIFLEKFSFNEYIHILGFVLDEDMAAIVNLAEATVLPSFYEGFGLTILESQICGTPVITSNLSAMPEVAGRGALFVDPNSTESIRLAIRKITSDRNLKLRLINFGFENVNKFSWEKTAKQTIEVYKQVINK